jgi:hypothetical protein
MKLFSLARMILLCLCCVSGMASAQSVTGQLVGLVTDPSGAAITDAKVTVRNTNTNQTFVLTTGKDGEYRAANLLPSNYEISVAAPGFSSATVPNIRLLLSATMRNDVSLTLGSADRTVEVSAAPDAISTETSSIGSVIDGVAVARLPLNGRTIDRALLYTAGNTSDSAASPNLGGGIRWGGTYYTVDGVPFNDLGNGSAAYSYNTNLSTLPSTETVQELKVESSLPKAEYEGGSAVSIITKSGSNHFHGTVYEFNRNRAYAARDFFTRVGVTPKPGLNRNEFGGVIGGPIWKNKTFFFGSAEYLLQRQGKPYTFTVPTDAMRAGDFSGLAVITDPTTGLPFPGNKITTIDPRSAALLAYYPRANQAGTGNNLIQSVPTKYDVKRYTLKFDHTLNSVHTLTLGGTYSVGDPYFAPNGTPANYGNYQTAGYTTQSAFFRDNMVFSSRMLNEIHYAYLSHRSIRLGQNTSFDPTTLFPGLYGPFSIGGLPTISMTGYTGIGDTGGSGHSPVVTQQILDNFTLVRGKHTFKVGAAVNFNALVIKSGTSSSSLGTFGFTGRYTSSAANTAGNAFADFLLGDLNSSVRAYPQIPIYEKYQNYAFFGQDDWNITPHLVLNLGMRYVLQTTPTEAHGDFTNFDFATGKFVIRTEGGNLPKDANATALALYPGVYTTSEQNGWGSSVLTTDKKDWGPRLGFAYRPLATDQLVIRGGYGISYNFVPNYIGVRQLAQLNFPFTLTQSYTATSSTTPSITFANPFPGTGTVAANPSIYAVNRDLKNTRVQQWNLTLEQVFPANVGFRLSYVGNKATQAPWYLYNKNLPNPMRPLTTLQSGRPYQPWGDILTLVTKGASFTNQMQVEVTKRTGNGLYLQTSYTWNTSLDNVPIAASPQDPYNPAGDRGNSEGTRRHNFFLSATYELPIHRHGMGERVVNGWSIASLTQVRSGTPFTPTFSVPGTVAGGGSSVGWYASRASIVPGADPYAGAHNRFQWFNPAAFQIPTAFTFGNARRNSLFGPKEVGIDLSLEKKTVVKEGVLFLLRFDAFNALNHPNFANPAANISTTSTVGVISGSNGNNPNRQVQIGAKVNF